MYAPQSWQDKIKGSPEIGEKRDNVKEEEHSFLGVPRVKIKSTFSKGA